MIERIERVHEHLERGMPAKSNGVEPQCTGRLGSLEGIETSVLIQRRDDRLSEHHQPDGRGHRQQQSQAHAVCQLGSKRIEALGHYQTREQRQCHRAQSNAEQTQGQLNEPECD